MTSTVLAYY